MVHPSFNVAKCCSQSFELWEKEQVHQTVTFVFKHYLLYSFKHLSQLINKLGNVWWKKQRWRHCSSTFSRSMSKLLTPNMHCSSHKTLVTICWVDISVNGISTKSFWPQKKNNRTERCSFQDTFDGNAAIYNVYNWWHSDVIIMKLPAGIQN